MKLYALFDGYYSCMENATIQSIWSTEEAGIKAAKDSPYKLKKSKTGWTDGDYYCYVSPIWTDHDWLYSSPEEMEQALSRGSTASTPADPTDG